MMDELRELYQQVIVDHNRSPRNCHCMDDANHRAEGFNPLCGDQLVVYLNIQNNKIENMSFTGSGCAISMASSSLMTEALKGKSTEQALEIFEQFHSLITEKDKDIDIDELGKLAVLAGVKDYPTRIKCATLAWHALKAAIEDKSNTVSTE